MTSDELQAWGDAISESFSQGEVYTVQSSPAGSARAVAVSDLESSLITGVDLDGRKVAIDKGSGVGSFVQSGPRRSAARAAGSSNAWNFQIGSPGSPNLYTTPMFGRSARYGVGASPSQPTFFKFVRSEDYSGSYGGQGSSASNVTGDIVLNVFWQDSSSSNVWKGSAGWGSYQVTYALQSLGQQIALDSYVNLYQSWWYYTSASSDNIVEKMRIRPVTSRLYLMVNNSFFADGATIWEGADGSKYVFHCDAWDDASGWRVYITDETGKLAAMKLPYVITKLGFMAEIGSESTAVSHSSSVEYNDPAMVALGQNCFGWAVSTVFYWKSGDGFVIGDSASGTDLTEVINAINQNTLTTANGCAQIVDAVNQQGGQIVDTIGGLPGKIASGLTPSEADVQSGVSDIQAKFSASYGNTKSLVDMVENLYVTLKDGFSGASEVTTWDFPGIKVKLNGSVHTICPEISVQKTDIGMQQYLALVVRAICVIALVWMIWSKVHRVIISKEADD